jgi:hypothetical protein
MRKLVLSLAAVGILCAGPALAVEQGTSLLSIGISQGVGDYAGPELFSSSPGYISAFSASEIGVTGEYWYMFASDYAVAFQGTYGFSSETNEPGTNAGPGALEAKFSTTSYKFRLGGDRVGQIGDRFTWFFGPGIEYWSGTAKFENFAAPPDDNIETEATTRYGINGRVGGIMQLSDAVGIQGQVGNTLGYATAEENGAKATWYPSSFNASWGLIFTFGGS